MISENLINTTNDILELKIESEIPRIIVKYSKSPLKKAIGNRSKVEVSLQKFYHTLDKFHSSSDLFFETGGVHSAGITDFNSILFFAEDTGRHNALDKVIGFTHRNNLRQDELFICISSRISLSIIRKIYFAEIGGIISISAPTSAAVEFANANNIVLIGFARKNRFNIYSGKKRLVFI